MRRIFDAYNLEKVQVNLLDSSDDELLNIINVYLFAKEKGLNQVFAVLVEQMLKLVDLNDENEKKYVLELVKEIKELNFGNIEEFRGFLFLTSQILFELKLFGALEIYYKCLKLGSEMVVCEVLFNSGGDE